MSPVTLIQPTFNSMIVNKSMITNFYIPLLLGLQKIVPHWPFERTIIPKQPTAQVTPEIFDL
jgi:hypothetical protein